MHVLYPCCKLQSPQHHFKCCQTFLNRILGCAIRFEWQHPITLSFRTWSQWHSIHYGLSWRPSFFFFFFQVITSWSPPIKRRIYYFELFGEKATSLEWQVLPYYLWGVQLLFSYLSILDTYILLVYVLVRIKRTNTIKTHVQKRLDYIFKFY
jgi:hypothetical protein